MPFVLILLGAILIVAAFNNTQGDLATALEQDVPPFLKWGLAVGVVGGLGWVPGLQTLSRWLLALVFTVIILKNYQQIINGFQALGGAGGSTTAAAIGSESGSNPTPAAAYIADPNNPQITQASISGSSGNVNAAGGGSAPVSPQVASTQPAYLPAYGSQSGAPVSPHVAGQLFLTAAELGFGGFGGVV